MLYHLLSLSTSTCSIHFHLSADMCWSANYMCILRVSDVCAAMHALQQFFLTEYEWIRRVFQHSLFRSSGLSDAWALFWPPTSCFVYTCLLIVIWFSLYCLCISCYRDFNDVLIQKYSINFMWMTSLLLPVQKRLQTELSRTEQHVGNRDFSLVLIIGKIGGSVEKHIYFCLLAQRFPKFHWLHWLYFYVISPMTQCYHFDWKNILKEFDC